MVNECQKCYTRGYEYADRQRRLCHFCLQKEQEDIRTANQLKGILRNFITDLKNPSRESEWPGAEFGKAWIGNAFIQAIQRYDSNFDLKELEDEAQD